MILAGAVQARSLRSAMENRTMINSNKKRVQIMPKKDFLDKLPKKWMSACMVLLSDKNELFVVKQSYRKCWSVPGGMGEKNESPRETVIRETKEEIGLDINNVRLLSVNWVSSQEGSPDGLLFVFFGGVLTDKQIKNIILDNYEIIDWKFINPAEAFEMLGGPERDIAGGIIKGLEALKNNQTVYLENGK